MDKTQLAGMIDHTLLKANATVAELKQLCAEAREYSFKTVCVNSANVALCAKELEGCVTKPIAVVGFPLGAMSSAAKAFETEQAVRDGAAEIDTVINVGALKGKDYSLVYEDILAVVKAAGDRPVKVIIESAMLSDDEKIIACALSKAAGAAFVKTSTGFAKEGKECIHNLGYWEDIPYLGLGLGASSYWKEKNSQGVEDRFLRFSNERDLNRYLENPFLPFDQREDYVELSREDRIAEFMFLGLRKMDGIDPEAFGRKFGCGLEEIYGMPIRKFLGLGLLSVKEGRLALTKKGIDVSNQIFCEFI